MGDPRIMPDSSIMTVLMGVIQERKTQPPNRPSYVVELLSGGTAKIGAKIREEAEEVVEAGAEPGEPGRAHLVREVADLVFHAMVLLGSRDLTWSDVEAELARRFGIGGITEKQSRGTSA